MSDINKNRLSETVRAKINSWMTRYPAEQKRSAVMAALQFAQEDNNGWLPEEVLEAVADYLDMPKIAVFAIWRCFVKTNF